TEPLRRSLVEVGVVEGKLRYEPKIPRALCGQQLRALGVDARLANHARGRHPYERRITVKAHRPPSREPARQISERARTTRRNRNGQSRLRHRDDLVSEIPA